MSDLVYVGFHSQVVALNAGNGQMVWDWKAHTGSGYVTLLLDGDRLFVSVNGYTYCLHARTGKELWFNALRGYGVGVVSLASTTASVSNILAAAAHEADQAAATTAATTTTT
ncbi:MAG TPA: PQQ-binding-like beta-propeller repeat protein [Phycisphaerae bacterium]|jgi:outer membrane protein assembly factor BamB|nr:PQQ-binding-like beta-propeller repeat protein [Phycisphaerae bacterium]